MPKSKSFAPFLLNNVQDLLWFNLVRVVLFIIHSRVAIDIVYKPKKERAFYLNLNKHTTVDFLVGYLV